MATELADLREREEQDEVTQAEQQQLDVEVLQSNFNKQLLSELKATANSLGENPIIFEQLFDRWNRDFWEDMTHVFFDNQFDISVSPHLPQEDRDDINETTLFDKARLELMMNYGRNWWASKFGPEVADSWAVSNSPGRGRSGTPDIRSQFDLDQLANRANDLHRAYLLTDADNPRAMAKKYVDQIVKTGGKEKIDFDTFILTNNIEGTARYASIYRNKPDGMSETDFIQPYYQTAQQVMRPDEAAATAIEGAQFGASAQQFQERLARSNEFRTSAPFMQNLEGRMRSIKDVFKG